MLVCVAGLGIYSDSESEGEGSGGGRGDTDSDEELRQTIRRKRKDFQATERDILQRLQAEEMAERGKKSRAQESESEEESEEQADRGGQDAKSEGEPDKATDQLQEEEEYPPVMGESSVATSLLHDKRLFHGSLFLFWCTPLCASNSIDLSFTCLYI